MSPSMKAELRAELDAEKKTKPLAAAQPEAERPPRPADSDGGARLDDLPLKLRVLQDMLTLVDAIPEERAPPEGALRSMLIANGQVRCPSCLPAFLPVCLSAFLPSCLPAFLRLSDFPC